MTNIAYNYETIQRDLIKALIAQPSAIPKVSEEISLEDFEQVKYKEIYSAILELHSENKPLTPAEIFEVLFKKSNVPFLQEDFLLFTNPPTDAPTTLSRILKRNSVTSKAIKALEIATNELKEGNEALETLGILNNEAERLSHRLIENNTLSFAEQVNLTTQNFLSDEIVEEYVIPTPYETLNYYLGGGFKREQLITVGARTGVGKALDINTPILTTKGWKTMGSLSYNDYVFGRDGKKTKVSFLSDIQFGRKCYEITFSNGEKIIADEDHLWYTSSVKERRSLIEKESVRTTKELFNSLRYGKDQRLNHSIKKPNPIDFEMEEDLPIDPYILGYWLGDGLSRTSTIEASKEDLPNLVNELERCQYYYKKITDCPGQCAGVKFSHLPLNTINNQFLNRETTNFYLKKLNLLQNKHIPEIYKKASIENRIELLKGLMDSDGSASKSGRQSFGVTRKALFNDTIEVARSLGLAPFLNKEKKVKGRSPETSIGYHFSFKSSTPYFKLTRKLNRVINNNNQREKWIYIKDIKEVPTRPVRCIQVDNDDHSYLAGSGLIPTHNTVVATNCAAKACSEGKSVLFFSLEMSQNELIKRLIASQGNILLNQLKPYPNKSEELKQRILNTQQEVSQWKLDIRDDTEVTMDHIRSIAQQKAQSVEGLDMIIIDYLQLISIKSGRGRSRQEEVAEISRTCKMLAKQLKIPVMVLVQLNRETKDDEEKIPSKADIRESAAIAADSDIILILHRKYRDDSTDPRATFILDKNRGGPADKMFSVRCVLEKNIFQDLREDETFDNNSGDEEQFANINEDSSNHDLTDEDFENLFDDTDDGDDFNFLGFGE